MKCPHCDTPIDEHEANRCLDAWVAETMMGYKKRVFAGQSTDSLWDDERIFDVMESAGLTHTINDKAVHVPQYSALIVAAWEVVLDYTGRQYRVWLEGEDGFDWSRWYCAIYTPTADPIGEGRDESGDLNIRLASAPLAICRAALKAVTHD